MGQALRNNALDGLRGLAALSVAVSHCILAVSGLAVWKLTIFDFPAAGFTHVTERLLHAVFPADGAVTLFFVLSGHVLCGSFERNAYAATDALDYLISRTYRLLPVAIVSAIPLAFLTDASARELAANMLLLSNSINGVLWTLQVEIICSIAIFGAWLWAGSSPRRILVILLAVLAVSPIMRGSNFFLFFPAFLVGALISAIPSRVFESRAVLIIGLICLAAVSLVLSHIAISRHFEIIGAAAIIGHIRARGLPIVEARPVLFLGRISYPFYLSHATGLLVSQRLLSFSSESAPLLQIAVYAVVSIPIAILVAWLLHISVERPAMAHRPRPKVSRLLTRLSPVKGFREQAREALPRLG